MRKVEVAGAAHLLVVPGAPLLRPDVQLFEAMLEGWAMQQRARNLATETIRARLELVRRFQVHAGEFPWAWTPRHVEEWSTDLLAVKGLAPSTLRGYQQAVKSFCGYASDPVYGWDHECEVRFGSHPVQVCHAWNTTEHRNAFEGRPGRRSLTRAELQLLFDTADDAVDHIRRHRRKGFTAAYRDATMLKVAYAWGLRRREVAMLDVVDFGRNPKAAEFGDFGVCYVRFGKAPTGSAPKRRSVLTVMPWSVEVIEQWVTEVWPACRRDGSSALWPSERSERVTEARLNKLFARIRDRAGLPTELTPHCLRHSYVTHLIEDGFDALFVQQQVGHEHASTTSLYTSVSSDYKTRVLRAALDRMLTDSTEVDQ